MEGGRLAPKSLRDPTMSSSWLKLKARTPTPQWRWPRCTYRTNFRSNLRWSTWTRSSSLKPARWCWRRKAATRRRGRTRSWCSWPHRRDRLAQPVQVGSSRKFSPILDLKTPSSVRKTRVLAKAHSSIFSAKRPSRKKSQADPSPASRARTLHTETMKTPKKSLTVLLTHLAKSTQTTL